MEKRKVITLLLFVLMGMGAMAQDATQRLVLWQKSGEKVYFDLEEKPETTFENGMIVIKTTTTTAMYQLKNVLRYTYEGTTTAIENPSVHPGEIRFMQSKDQMTFDGLVDGTRIDVYSVDGKLLNTLNAAGGQKVIVSFAGQPTGIYVVKIGDATYKFLKR